MHSKQLPTIPPPMAEGGESDRRGTYLLGTLTLGHAAVHWFQQLWPVIVPSIKESLGLSNVQIGTLSSVKQFTTGPLMLPSGILADFFRKQTAYILGGAFLFLGLAHLLVGISPTFVWLLPTVGLLGIGTVLWHPAAMASLSLRFPQRRATALAVHGMGGSVGDTIAPIAIGGLLLTMSWRSLLEWHMVPAILLAFVFWKATSSVFHNEKGTRPTLGSYWTDMKELVGHRVVLAMAGVNVFTSMARLSVLTFLPIYLQEERGYSPFLLGVHIALLHLMGIVSQPVLGSLSDRFGRKTILLPSVVIFGCLYFGLAGASSGIQIALVVGGLGLFFYALATVTQATVMDVASDRVQGSTMGVMTLLSQFLSLPSPILAGWVAEVFGLRATFIYAGVATLLGALLLAFIRVPRVNTGTSKIPG